MTLQPCVTQSELRLSIAGKLVGVLGGMAENDGGTNGEEGAFGCALAAMPPAIWAHCCLPC
jgi:hypothetical protein